eukprot:GILI01003326.1.p1 GENE.GILI01003326.1~~GILI01003326.1.p1  ORF type:complete len:317 (+),score=63.11 GILI01003326.1:264-1214(+)
MVGFVPVKSSNGPRPIIESKRRLSESYDLSAFSPIISIAQCRRPSMHESDDIYSTPLSHGRPIECDGISIPIPTRPSTLMPSPQLSSSVPASSLGSSPTLHSVVGSAPPALYLGIAHLMASSPPTASASSAGSPTAIPCSSFSSPSTSLILSSPPNHSPSVSPTPSFSSDSEKFESPSASHDVYIKCEPTNQTPAASPFLSSIGQVMDDIKFLNLSSTSERIGTLTREERAEKIRKYLDKKNRRVWDKKVRYECRKNLADRRQRVKGRFVKGPVEGAEEGVEGTGPAVAVAAAVQGSSSSHRDALSLLIEASCSSR